MPLESVIAIATWLGILATTGSGFYFIGRLSAKVDHANEVALEAKKMHVDCRLERVACEERLFGKVEGLQVSVAAHHAAAAAAPRRT